MEDSKQDTVQEGSPSAPTNNNVNDSKELDITFLSLGLKKLASLDMEQLAKQKDAISAKYVIDLGKKVKEETKLQTVFFSWQSDDTQTRNKIKNAIEKSLKRSPSLLTFRYDEATRNESGTVDIADTILTKIKNADMFVCDVSLVLDDPNHRKSPNPNVMIELGWAAAFLGWERIFCITNTDFGPIESLPFDIRGRRVASFDSKTNNSALEKIVGDSLSTMWSELPSKKVRAFFSEFVSQKTKLRFDVNKLSPSNVINVVGDEVMLRKLQKLMEKFPGIIALLGRFNNLGGIDPHYEWLHEDTATPNFYHLQLRLTSRYTAS